MDNGEGGGQISGFVCSQWQTVREHLWETHTAVLPALTSISPSQSVCNTYHRPVNTYWNDDREKEKLTIEKAKQFATSNTAQFTIFYIWVKHVITQYCEFCAGRQWSSLIKMKIVRNQRVIGLFHRRHLTCHSKSTSTNNINNSSVIFKYPNKSWQCDSESECTRTPKLIPSLILLFTPVVFLLQHVKMFSVGKAYWGIVCIRQLLKLLAIQNVNKNTTFLINLAFKM